MFVWNAIKTAVQGCPLAKGIICITVTRLDTKQPITDIKVNVDGPTPGNSPTNPQGISQFEERDPGAYQFGVSFPSKYKDWIILPYSPELAVSGGSVAIAEVYAYPVGTLKVRVVRDDGDGAEGVVDTSKVWTGKGPESLSAEAPKGVRTFEKVYCGEYDVFGSASPDLYDPYEGSVQKVVVPEGGVGEAVIKVVPKTWIKLKVHDVDTKTDVLRYSATMKLLDGVVGLNNPGNTGLIDLTLKRQGKTCGVQQIDCAEDVMYEVVEVARE
jgi:hypothetical protein